MNALAFGSLSVWHLLGLCVGRLFGNTGTKQCINMKIFLNFAVP